MPFLFEFTSAQTITKEQDSKHQLPVVTSRCIDLELLGYAYTFKTSVYNQQRCVNNNKRVGKILSGEKIRNIIFSFFTAPPSHNYILDHSKQLFFYNISSLNASFRRVSNKVITFVCPDFGHFFLIFFLPLAVKLVGP